MYFYGSNLGPLARGHLGPWDLGLNKLGKGPPSNATYQISSTRAKQFWRRRFLSIFHFGTQDPPPQGHFEHHGHHLNKLGRGPLGNATYQIPIKALGLAVSEEMSFEAIVDDGHWLMAIAHREPDGNSSP